MRITSTLSDLYSAVTGAIGALMGPLHGGANETVMHVFDEIGTADNTVAWFETSLAEKRKIMSFGHRVYKNGDSRVPTMKRRLTPSSPNTTARTSANSTAPPRPR